MAIFNLYSLHLHERKQKVTCKSYTLVTLENNHSSSASFALDNFLINKVNEDAKITSIKFWSDGCASQCCSQSALYMMTKSERDVELQWYYFEASHGKGAVYGIGGMVKHAVFRHVLRKQVVIKSPKHFAKYADSILPNIRVIFVDDDDLQLNFHKECREKAVYVYATLQVQFVEYLTSDMKYKLKFYMTLLS